MAITWPAVVNVEIRVVNLSFHWLSDPHVAWCDQHGQHMAPCGQRGAQSGQLELFVTQHGLRGPHVACCGLHGALSGQLNHSVTQHGQHGHHVALVWSTWSSEWST